MKNTLIPILILFFTGATAQTVTAYYAFDWKPTDAKHARFISVTEHTDSGWHRMDFYIQGPSLQMDGWYEDSACDIRSGKFTFAYPDKKMLSTGRYVHGKREGLWVSYHPNGMMADSIVYKAGQPVGQGFKWYQDGSIADSSIFNEDGSGVEVAWFDNGKPSAAGRFAAGHKMNGRWEFFHKTGQLSALELYDHGKLMEKQYFDNNGQPQTDTTNRDHKAYYGKDSTGWLKYLNNHLSWPPDYKIVNGDMAAVVVAFSIDEDGNVSYPYIRVPFFPPFEREALNTIKKCPKWQPALEHNRTVRADFTQPVIFRQPSED